MSEVDLNNLRQLLEIELHSEKLEQIPKTLYKDAASYVKSIICDAKKSGESVATRLKDQEKELLYSFLIRLLEIRIQKAAKSSGSTIDEGRLTPEEKYILETLAQTNRRINNVKEAIKGGRSSLLSRISTSSSPRFTVVRFLKPMSSIMGSDLKRYGPFQKGDVTTIPSENARPLLKQGSVEEIWVEK
jgi:DNA replication initiation complex subunit (GINS family)